MTKKDIIIRKARRGQPIRRQAINHCHSYHYTYKYLHDWFKIGRSILPLSSGKFPLRFPSNFTPWLHPANGENWSSYSKEGNKHKWSGKLGNAYINWQKEHLKFDGEILFWARTMRMAGKMDHAGERKHFESQNKELNKYRREHINPLSLPKRYSIEES